MISVILQKIVSALTVILTFLGVSVLTPYDKPIDTQNGGDPFIVEDSGNFYYTYTTGGGVDIVQIESLDNATYLQRKVVFWCGESDTVADIWAPEIHKIGDRWYIIATALFNKEKVPKGLMPLSTVEDDNDYYRYSFVLESNTEDILSDYTFKGILAPGGYSNIDGTYLKKDGKLYFICSGYRDRGNQALYISEMENPYTLKTDENGNSTAVMLSEPEYRWERHGWPVNEGPAVLYNNDDIYLVYSASGYSSDYYCLGMLTLTGDDVMNAENWSKSRRRVLYHQPLKSIYNPGHCSFLHRENGETFMVYHANATLDFEQSPRLTYIKEIEFKNNAPVFR